MMHSEFSDISEELICYPEEEACILEVYSTPQDHQQICDEASNSALALQDEIYIDINLEQESLSFDQLASTRRVGAATQVLPLLSSVYEDRSSSEAACGGLSWEYRSALSGETSDSRVCLICQNSFLSPTKLLHHAAQQHHLKQLKIQQCFVCRQAYVFPEALVSHLQDFHALPSPQLTCRVCYCQLSSRSELKAHTRKHELSEACMLCFAHFPSRHQLTEHNDTCHAKPFSCTSCRQRFCNELVLRRHEFRHFTTSQLMCECGFHAAPETPDREWSLLHHLQQCQPVRLRNLMTESVVEDQEETTLDTLLSIYHQRDSSDNDSPVEQCVRDLMSSVSSLPNNDEQQNQLADGEDPQLTCQLCSDRCKAAQCSSDSVLSHLATSHPRTKLCPFCRKRFSSAARARRHARKHAQSIEATQLTPEQLSCQHCQKTFTAKGKLNWHLEYHHKLSQVEKPHKCPSCPRKFLFAASRDKHVASHAQGEVVNPGSKNHQVLKCPYCPIKFIKPSYLKRHEQKYHPGEEKRYFECNHCGDKVGSLPKLRRHVTYKHGPAADKQRYACPQCPIGCRTAVGLKTHLRVHSGETPYNCLYCSKGFKRKHALTVHLRGVHGIIDSTSSSSHTSFLCSECPLQMVQKSALVKHFLRAHRNLRRFVCGLCGERYCQNQELKQHMTSKHSTRAPSISRESRHEQTHVYVFPGIDKLPSSHPHAMLISQIVEDEKRKTENLPDFSCIQGSEKGDSNEPRLSTTVKTKLKIPTSGSSKPPPSEVAKLNSPVFQDLIVLPPVPPLCAPSLQLTEASDIMSSGGKSFISQDGTFISSSLEVTQDNQISVMLSNPCVTERSEIPSYTVWVSPDNSQVVDSQQLSKDVIPFIFKTPNTIVIGEDGTVKTPNLLGSDTVKVTKSSKTKTKSPSQRFKCSKCDKSFAEKPGLDRHSKVHSDIFNYNCTVCSKPFREKFNLAVHMRSHTKHKPYSCRECSKTFRYHQELEDHMTHHRGERPFSCSQCPNRSFVRVKDLRRHEKTTHQTESSKFKCELCEKRFSRKDALEVHLKSIHSNLGKPFKCNVCEHSFASEKLLQRHKALHSGRKDHICSQCNKAFATNSYLQGHLRTHARQSEYLQCSLCPRRFSTQHTLQVHQNSFHDKHTMQRKRQEQMLHQQMSETGNLEVDLDLAPLELAPGESDIQVVYLQVLSESDLDILP